MTRHVRSSSALALIVALGLTTSACLAPTSPPPPASVTHRSPLCTGGRPEPCLPPEEVEAWLHHPHLQIEDAAAAHRGKQHAQILTLALPDSPGTGRLTFRAKWRPQSEAKLNYSEPRVAVATYYLQKRLVPPSRYVIPPTVLHCFDVAHYRAHVAPDAHESFAGSDCVMGSLSYWLESAKPLDEVESTDWYDHDRAYDERLFSSNDTYRAAISTINLLTYLVQSGDAHRHQFLIEPDPRHPQVYLVDNSMGFGAKINSALADTPRDWTTQLVPFPQGAVERALAWDDEDYRSFASLERHRLGRGLRYTGRGAETLNGRSAGGMTIAGGHLHVGLAEEEIRTLRARVDRLRIRAARGELPMLPRRSRAPAP